MQPKVNLTEQATVELQVCIEAYAVDITMGLLDMLESLSQGRYPVQQQKNTQYITICTMDLYVLFIL